MRAPFFWIPAVSLATAMLAHERGAVAQLQLNPAEVATSRATELPPPGGPYREEAAADPASEARPRLGVTFDPNINEAAVAVSIMPGGAAEQAGLEPGDTIEAINGNRVQSPDEVLRFIDTLRAGEIVDIDFSRRITGRTQAVLTGEAQDRSNAAYREGNSRIPDEVDQATYEDLPAPPYSIERAQPYSYSRDRLQPAGPRRVYYEPRYRAPRVIYEDDRDDERDERDRRGRLFDRDREPSSRSRPLLPWRR